MLGINRLHGRRRRIERCCLERLLAHFAAARVELGESGSTSFA